MSRVLDLLAKARRIVLATDYIEPEGIEEELMRVTRAQSLREAIDALLSALRGACRREFEVVYDNPVLRGRTYGLGMFACRDLFVVYGSEVDEGYLDYEFFAGTRKEAERELKRFAEEIVEDLEHALGEARSYGATKKEVEELERAIEHLRREYLSDRG